MAPPHDTSPREPRRPIGLAVRLTYGTVDEFAERFAVNLSRGGVFIRSSDPKPPGTHLKFELRLSTGEAAIRGEGVVRWAQPADPHARPPKAPGMGVQFTSLDEPSRALVERMVALKEQRGLAPGVAAPAPVAERPLATPPPTRAREPILTPAPLPAQADLSAPHRVEQLQAGPARVELGLPAKPGPQGKPSAFVIGIDLGTSNSCAAVVKDGRPYVIPSREGYNVVPSVVALNARNRVVVGQQARAQLLTNPRHTVFGAKRLLGRPFDSDAVEEIRSRFPYEIVADPDGFAGVQLGPERLTLEQVAALILREVKEIAQNHLGEEVNRAVITVPAYYNERQRAAVRKAGALAGLAVERIVNEPTAAALAYGYGRHVTQRVLVYDLGGGTFDASVLELAENVYEVVSTGGDTFLGGVDFDAHIVERLLADWKKQTGSDFDGDRVALSRLVDAAERAKCALSERTEFPIQLPFLAMKDGKPVSLETKLTREDVVQLVSPLVERTIDVCREVLLGRGLTTKDIDEVLLVGGQSRMPLVQEQVSAFFGKAPSKSVHPDEAVAVGAALLAHSLSSAEGIVLIDVLPMSIGIGLPGGRMKTILERNTPLPTRKQYGLVTTRDGQTEFELVVMQGEPGAEVEYLGTLKLSGLPPGPRGMVKISVTFELGVECLLTVTAREQNSGREVKTVLSAREGVNAARRRLQAEAEHRPPGATPAPIPPRPEAPPAPLAAAPRTKAAQGALGSLLRKLFRRERDEAR
ncbi:MAG: TIGR02266 family protein [Anaeromyxobacteraceae bacterium]